MGQVPAQQIGDFGGQLAEALEVLGGDAVERVQLDGVGVRLARVAVFAELGERFAEAVVGVHLVGKQLQDLAIELAASSQRFFIARLIACSDLVRF